MIIGSLGIRETYDDVRTWGTPIRKDNEILAQHRWESWMIECCELLLTWKFRFNAGNREDGALGLVSSVLFAAALVLWLGYYSYLRLFYQLRVRKDGTKYDQRKTMKSS